MECRVGSTSARARRLARDRTDGGGRNTFVPGSRLITQFRSGTQHRRRHLFTRRCANPQPDTGWSPNLWRALLSTAAPRWHHRHDFRPCAQLLQSARIRLAHWLRPGDPAAMPGQRSECVFERQPRSLEAIAGMCHDRAEEFVGRRRARARLVRREEPISCFFFRLYSNRTMPPSVIGQTGGVTFVAP